MIFKKLALVTCTLLAVTLTVSAQDDSVSLKTIISKTTQYSQNFPSEKVYLHFDKPYYAVGDTIWFKAYITLEQHQLSAISKIVYVDLINSRDSIVAAQRIQVANGVASGNIILPQATFIEGNYHVRAYTDWMRNFDADYFFTKNITIGNNGDNTSPVNTHISFINSVTFTTEKIDAKILYKDADGAPYTNRRVSWKVQSDDETIDKGKGVTDQNGLLNITFASNKTGIFAAADLITNLELNYKKTITNTFSLKTAAKPKDVQFFPEGGNLLAGTPTKVAFKAINSNGLGVDVKGTITDETNKEVANFTSQHLGMGMFVMQAEAGKAYKANVTFADGTLNSYDLPRVLDEGISLAVNNLKPDTLILKLVSNPQFLQKFANTKFYIVAQSGGSIYYAAQTALQSLVYIANIPKTKFPTGILQISLLTDEGDPISERIVFIQRNDLLNITLTTHPVYSIRQKVIMGLTAKNKAMPVVGAFSLSVTDETKIPYNEDKETTILSSLLLSSELKGYIEDPNYYFNHVDADRTANLELLMLTQGYRKFVYSDIIAGKNPSIYYLPEQGIVIRGSLRTNTGIPVSKANVHLTIPDKIFSADAITDAQGFYVFPNLDIPDSAKVTISAKNNAESKFLVVTANSETAPPFVKNINSPDNITNIDSTMAVYLKNSKRQYSGTQTLKEVIIKAKSAVKKPSHLDYTSLIGLSMEPDHLINGSQLNSCNFILDCLRGAAFGFTFDDALQNFYISRDYNSGNKNTPVAIYYNGLLVDVPYLTSINPNMVESVEIFLNNGIADIGKMNNTKGVMVINGKKIEKGEKISLSEFKDLIPQSNVTTFSPLGYARKREFYEPKYFTVRPNMDINDLRTTIYWNPKIVTDANGKAVFEFYNADGKGSYRAVIEGIDGDGNLAHYVYHYRVE